MGPGGTGIKKCLCRKGIGGTGIGEKTLTKKWLRNVGLLGIVLLFTVTRLWQLSSLPFGLHIDEAGMAYDAWCLSQYGVDRYLKSWPVYLMNFGGGQNALYTFVCAGMLRLFGYSIRIIRMPAVICSFLNLIFGMKLVAKMYPGRELMPVAAGGLLVICPYFIMAGRFGLESNLMLGMSTLFLYCFAVAIESGKLYRYMLAGLTGGLLLYTYAPVYMILPLFFLLAMVYLIRMKRFSLKGWAVMAVPLGILAVPLILVQIVNLFDLEEFRLGCFTITKLAFYRASEVGHFTLSHFLLALKSIFIGDSLNYNSIPGRTNLYVITIPLAALGFVMGLIKSVKSGRQRDGQFAEKEFFTIVLLWFLSMLFFESHIESNVNKTNGIFFSVIVLAVEGLDTLRGACGRLVRRLWKGREKAAEIAAAAGLCSIYLFCFGNFGVYYFGGHYSAETYPLDLFDLTVTEALDFVEQDPVLCRKITQMAEKEIYYAVSTLEDPYQLRVQLGTGDGIRYKNHWIGCLGEISDEYNYIVRDGFEEYCEELRKAGFTEERFTRYSLFYKKTQ